MVVTKSRRNLLFAYEKGYRCDSSGNVSLSGKNSLKLYCGKSKYLCFSVKLTTEVQDKPISRAIPVHRLQGYQKFGYRIFEKGIHVRHLNGNCKDNSWENIGIGTVSENMMDKPEEARIRWAINASNKARRFTDDEMSQIREFHKIHKSYKKTMTEFNISSKGTLHHMLNVEYQTTK